MVIESDLTKAVNRSCFWVPDYAFLSLLKPMAGRTLLIGPPLRAVGADSANQTLAASTTAAVSINFNTVTAGSLQMPNVNQVFMWESLSGTLTATDASGKLQITESVLYHNGGFSQFAGPNMAPLPFTFPALSGRNWVVVGTNPIPLQYGQPSDPNGPTFYVTLTNTDGSASHTYKRQIAGIYRLIDNVDLSSGPAMPGAGVGI